MCWNKSGTTPIFNAEYRNHQKWRKEIDLWSLLCFFVHRYKNHKTMINPKKLVGEKAAEYVKNGMKVGLGTGSTASFAIEAIGSMVKQGLKVTCFPTSIASEQLADSLSIPLLEEHEVDTNKNLIKGGGGALLRDKIVGKISDQYIIIVDDSKLVAQLGAFSVPVEVVPFAWEVTANQINQLGGETTLREADDGFFKT